MRFALATLLTAAVVLGHASGCGPRSETPDEGLGVVAGIDTTRDGLVRFSRSGDYAGWRAEPERHKTAAPHGSQVRVFFNDALVQSMEAGNTVHPKGSATVKEIYKSDGSKSGHAVTVKVVEGEGPDNWLYFEGFLPDYEDPFYGRAHPTCTGCHQRTGVDFVSSPLP
jgi:hypothetical protein